MTVVNTVEGQTSVAAPRHTPLEHRTRELAESCVGGRRGVRLVEEPFLTQIDLRMPEAFDTSRVQCALGMSVPLQSDRVCGDEHNAVLWLGPDEWLVVAPDGRAETLIDDLHAVLSDTFASTVDVSANRTTVRLAGRVAREVLDKVCSLDLHPRVFGPGRCAQTLIGRTQAVLWQVDAEPSYRIMVRCSFANHLADVLLDAMAEFGEG